MEILLTEVAEKHRVDIDNLKDFLIVNSDIFHFTQDKLSEEIYVNKFDSEDLIFLFQDHTKKISNYNSTDILEEYVNSFFENTEKVSDYV